MSRKLVLVLVFLMLLVCLQYTRFPQNRVDASDGYPVHNLNTGLNYTTIQEAINSNETLDGHVLHVDAGTYYEHLAIDKSIALLGENRSTTIIDGNGTGTVVSITANDMTIRGFTIENTNWFGIQVSASNNVTIEDNNVIKAFYGIRLDDSSECRVTRNIVENNTFLGILLSDSTNNILRENQMASNVENFGVWGISLAPFVNDVDKSNMVDGKPIYYLVNQYNKQITNDAGLAIVVNCTNITVKNLNVRNEDQGVMFRFTNSSSVKNSTVSNCTYGIDLFYSYDNTIVNNLVFNSTLGVSLRWSYENRVFNDTSISNGYGIYLYSSDRNTIANNEFSYGGSYGISFGESTDNSFYHNNIVNNKENFDPQSFGNNVWDNGLEGNFWSDYSGADSNQDGIGDTPYIINENNTDHYPLMGTFQSFNVSITPQSFGEVDVISNFTISDLGLYEWLATPNQYLQAGQSFLRLVPVQEQNMTAGFCRMTLPNNILNTSEYIVLINMTPVIVNKLAMSNGTHTTLYFTFNSSALDGIIIVPEFPSFLVVPSFMVATLLAIVIYKRRHLTRAP